MCPYKAPLPPGNKFNQTTEAKERDYMTRHYQFSEFYYPTVRIKDFGIRSPPSPRDRCQNHDKNNYYPGKSPSSS